MEDDPISRDLLRIHKIGGQYLGRTFLEVRGKSPVARDLLNASGAIFHYKINQSYLLPEASAAETEALIDRVAAAAGIDNVRANEERVPVTVELAQRLSVGEMFDFGPPRGMQPILRMGQPFTLNTDPISDKRVRKGMAMVYLYNANPPAVREKMTAERRQAEIAERDRGRTLVVAGSAQEGDMVSVSGTPYRIAGFGGVFQIKPDRLDDMKRRFPDAEGILVGVDVQYATLAPDGAGSSTL